jgi:hypothetical protein
LWIEHAVGHGDNNDGNGRTPSADDAKRSGLIDQRVNRFAADRQVRPGAQGRQQFHFRNSKTRNRPTSSR